MSKKILRVSSFAYHVGKEEYKLPETPDSPYVVDDANFVPMAEAIKQLTAGNSGMSKEQLQYDFPDGKDNGKAIPFSRSAQFKDIAELSTEINNSQTDIQNKLDEAKRLNEFQEKVKADLQPSTPTPSGSE